MGIFILLIIIAFMVIIAVISSQQDKLLTEILTTMELKAIDLKLKYYDDYIVVKSRRTLNDYDDIKYFKNIDYEKIKKKAEEKMSLRHSGRHWNL